MTQFSIREIILVLALVVVSTNWALDHRAQVARQEERQRELEGTLRRHEQALQSLGFNVTRDGRGLVLGTR
jgi:hypothetical protein